MHGQITILLIEPDPQVAQLLLLLLAVPDTPSRRFEWTCVQDVLDGLSSLARRGTFDAVLLGPSLRGDKLLVSARTLAARAPQLPVVVLLSGGPEPRESEVARLGARCHRAAARLDLDSVKRVLASAVAERREGALPL